MFSIRIFLKSVSRRFYVSPYFVYFWPLIDTHTHTLSHRHAHPLYLSLSLSFSLALLNIHVWPITIIAQTLFFQFWISHSNFNEREKCIFKKRETHNSQFYLYQSLAIFKYNKEGLITVVSVSVWNLIPTEIWI